MTTITVSACEMAPSSDPQPPSGGVVYVLDYDTFVAEIDTILTERGCDNLSCHGGGIRGTFALSPVTDKDVAMDFSQARLQVTPADPGASPLLLKPLSVDAGGVAHAGDSPTPGFASTDDPAYQAILSWILAGEYQQ